MATFAPQEDYYAILEVSSDATTEEIRQSYQELVRRYHPDSPKGNTYFFRKIRQAYQVLGEPSRRRAYDQQRRQRNSDSTLPFTWDTKLSRSTLPTLTTSQMLYTLVNIRPQSTEPVGKRLNLALVIDCSASMKGTPLHYVKMAALDVLKFMHPNDILAIIAFNDRARVLTPSTPARNRIAFSSALASLSSAGGTEIYQGLMAGLEQVRRYASDEYINHVLLLTDGRTYGDEDRAVFEAQQAYNQGIYISAFGIGEEWNDKFLDDLARAGGGISQYISSPSAVRKVLREQIQELNKSIAHKLRLHVKPADGVQLQSAYRAAPYMELLDRTLGNVLKLGRLVSEEPMAILLEFIVPPRQAGPWKLAQLELAAEDLGTGEKLITRQELKVNIASEVVNEPLPPQLFNYLSRINAFRLQENAWRALDAGDTKQATSLLEAAATQLFDMGYGELAQAAMLEVGYIARGGTSTGRGRKKLRYGTRSLSIPSIQQSRRGNHGN